MYSISKLSAKFSPKLPLPKLPLPFCTNYFVDSRELLSQRGRPCDLT